MEAGRAVYTVGVEQSHGGHFELGTRGHQFLGQGSAFEKAECGAGVKFYEQVLSSRFSVLSSQFSVENLSFSVFAEN